MPTKIDFYFDFVSPYTYLASTQLPCIAAQTNSSIDYKPFDLVALMKIVGNRPTSLECSNKFKYVIKDVQRWAGKYNVGFKPTEFIMSIDFAQLTRGALVANDDGRAADYTKAVFAALWQDSVDLRQRSKLLRVLDSAGIDSGRLLDRADSAEYRARLEADTTAAANRGIFGSPTIFVGDEMFFGNDRLDFAADIVRRSA